MWQLEWTAAGFRSDVIYTNVPSLSYFCLGQGAPDADNFLESAQRKISSAIDEIHPAARSRRGCSGLPRVVSCEERSRLPRTASPTLRTRRRKTAVVVPRAGQPGLAMAASFRASSSRFNGLVRKSSIPASMQRSRSPGMTFAVSAMMGTRSAPASFSMARI